MDGWMDGRMDGGMDGWMDGYKNQTFVARKKVYKGELPKIDKFIIIWRNEEKPKTKVISATSTKFILKSKTAFTATFSLRAGQLYLREVLRLKITWKFVIFHW